MLLDIPIGFVSQSFSHQRSWEAPLLGEHVMKYKWTKLDGSINQPKLERIQSLTLTFIVWHAFHLLCNNIYLFTMFSNFEVYDEWMIFIC
jgi:hypothetical protein